jgi:hypothetical protein
MLSVSNNPVLSTTTVGDIAEYMVAARFMQLGFEVLEPMSNGYPYDLVVSSDDGYKRIQVKNGRLREGTIRFNACSLAGRKNTQEVSMVREYYVGKIDYFAVYCAELNKVYLVDIDEVGTTAEIRLRLEPTRHNQTRGVRMAHDYEL